MDELVLAVNIVLGLTPSDACWPLQSDTGTRATVAELTRAVVSALSGCPALVCGSGEGSCSAGSFCELPAMHCDGMYDRGDCLPIPETCPATVAPVEGCDAVIYDNDCKRQMAGVRLDRLLTPACGIADTAPCSATLFCDLPPGNCGATAVAGACTLQPETCPRLLDPVCGCDGTTYANDCLRRIAGVSMWHYGTCGQRCGGFVGLGCPNGYFCEFVDGTCGNADLFGECVWQSLNPYEVCWQTINVDERVCGCDGVTYENECFRRKAGVSKAHDGACGAAPTQRAH